MSKRIDGDKAFLLYYSSRPLFEYLSDSEAKALLLAAFDYAQTGIYNDPSNGQKSMLGMAYSQLCSQIDITKEHYASVSRERARAGQKGGLAAQQNRRDREANEANAPIAKANEANEANGANQADIDIEKDTDTAIAIGKGKDRGMGEENPSEKSLLTELRNEYTRMTGTPYKVFELKSLPVQDQIQELKRLLNK